MYIFDSILWAETDNPGCYFPGENMLCLISFNQTVQAESFIGFTSLSL